jgi:hypothetical protein
MPFAVRLVINWASPTKIIKPAILGIPVIMGSLRTIEWLLTTKRCQHYSMNRMIFSHAVLAKRDQQITFGVRNVH